MPKALVTGGSGFLGSLLVQRLLDEGHTVTNIDRLPSALKHERLRTVVGDIRDRALLETALAGAAHDVVFHCAALLAHSSMPGRTVWNANVEGTRALAAATAKAGIESVVFTSSNCLWGHGFDRPVREDDAPAPIEEYGASKWECEKVLAACADRFATAIIRCPTIIDEGRLGLLSILFEFIAEGRRVWVVGDGSNRYQFIYAHDLIDAMLAAWRARSADVFGIGSDAVGTMRESYEYVISESGSRSRIGMLPKRATLIAMQAAHRLGLSPLGPYHYRMIASDFVFDTTRIKTALRWKPTLSNREMLLKSYRYYFANRSDIERRTDVSPHRRPSEMGIIRALKWIS